jgi:tetratricopeptide (TPR) repeat protein
MLHLAERAVCEIRRLSGRRYGSAPLADLRALSWAELGNAHRVADNLPAASSCLARAVRSARRGTGADCVTARLADLAASLWADQGRFADAIEALERLAVLYQQLGDDHLAGRALIKHGNFLGQDNQPRRAIVSLTKGISLIDAEREPSLPSVAYHALASMLVKCEQFREARALLFQVQHLLRKEGSPLNLLRLGWLWGKIYSGLGQLDRAEIELQAVRAGMGEAGKPYHQALVSLDLAEVYVRQGRRSEAWALAQKMLATFRRLGIAREIIAVLLLTRERCKDPFIGTEALCHCFREVAVLVAELDRVPTRRRRGGRARRDPPSLFV